ncbi:Fe-S cluster assembly sulfur transfer protein SufU [Deinococcus altitudinis]|uniref:Fe-S cluster assembly sulfur transfer protein SufU n=1 Tax=Deinococcus altitudinis TaxID=468914 RepID=UPI0038918A62
MLPETVAREIIASHQQRPRNRGELAGEPFATLENQGCGDRVTVWARLEGDTIADLHFEGKGCAISQSSASMMTVTLKGRTLAEAQALAASFRQMVMGEAAPDAVLGDLQALNGVSRLHARRKCALLPWNALKGLLESAPDRQTPPAHPPVSHDS